MPRMAHLGSNHQPQQRQQSSSSQPKSSTRQVLQRAQDDPESLGIADVQVLQRTIGNRATTQLLSASPVKSGVDSGQNTAVQRSLHAPAGDKVGQHVEQQTDRAGAAQPFAAQTQLSVQRNFGADLGGAPVLQASRRSFSTIQRKGGNETDEIKNIQKTLTPNFTPKSTDDPAKFEVTVAVAQGMPEYLQFAKTRMKSTIRNKARGKLKSLPGIGSLVRDPKTSAEIKNKAAKKAAPKDNAGQAADADVNRIEQDSHNVGHSWIKFNTYGASGDLIGTYSFGFIPGQAPTNPQAQVPGHVRNPDLEFENDENRRYQATTVPAKKYLTGLRKATSLAAAPPNYSTIGYNCTKFVKDVGKAAGAALPSKIGLIIPISNRGLFKSAANPNKLFDKLGAGSDSNSLESQMMNSGDYDFNDNGMLVSKEEIAKNWTADDVVLFLSRKQYVASMLNDRGRDAWEEEGLRDFHLKLLSKEDIKEVIDDFDLEYLHKLYELMGVSTENLPAMRRRNPWDRW